MPSTDTTPRAPTESSDEAKAQAEAESLRQELLQQRLEPAFKVRLDELNDLNSRLAQRLADVRDAITGGKLAELERKLRTDHR